ncbi:hypothetical protein FKM82_016486 [Ascaphus truei]
MDEIFEIIVLYACVNVGHFLKCQFARSPGTRVYHTHIKVGAFKRGMSIPTISFLFIWNNSAYFFFFLKCLFHIALFHNSCA